MLLLYVGYPYYPSVTYYLLLLLTSFVRKFWSKTVDGSFPTYSVQSQFFIDAKKLQVLQHSFQPIFPSPTKMTPHRHLLVPHHRQNITFFITPDISKSSKPSCNHNDLNNMQMAAPNYFFT